MRFLATAAALAACVTAVSGAGTRKNVTTEVDYVIVGSGISGAAIAHKLLTRCPSLSVLMLEARTAASGASGRNGGHCRAGWWLNHKKYVEAYGEEEAVKFGVLEEQNIGVLGERNQLAFDVVALCFVSWRVDVIGDDETGAAIDCLVVYPF